MKLTTKLLLVVALLPNPLVFDEPRDFAPRVRSHSTRKVRS